MIGTSGTCAYKSNVSLSYHGKIDKQFYSKPSTQAKINSPKSSSNSNATDVSKTPNKSEKVKTDNAKKRPQDFDAENDEKPPRRSRRHLTCL